MKVIQEHVILSEKTPFLVSRFEEPELNYPFHHHANAYELTLTLGMTGTRLVGDNTSLFYDKDLVLVGPGLPHFWHDHGVRNSNNSRVIVVQFSEELIPDNLRKSQAFQQINRALKGAQRGLELVGKTKKQAVEIIDNFDNTNGLNTYLGILKVLQLFGDKTSVQKLCGDAYSQPDLRYESQRIEKVLHFIQENYSRKLPIEEVAEKVHMSASAFSHYFKKRTLKSFTEYIVELRLGKAAQLLQHTELQVSEVAYECGFQNISHFNATFSRKYELSPLRFRKKKLFEKL